EAEKPLARTLQERLSQHRFIEIQFAAQPRPIFRPRGNVKARPPEAPCSDSGCESGFDDHGEFTNFIEVRCACDKQCPRYRESGLQCGGKLEPLIERNSGLISRWTRNPHCHSLR